jgi:predicted short-subunit dehydrogenase-like oxidoreductase (DUF2520 family)
MTIRPMKIRPMKIGIAGTGRVAQALGRHVGAQLVAGRSPAHTRAAAEFMGDAEPVAFAELVCDRLLIAVSDGAISEVAALVPTPYIALHTCGAYGAEILRPLHLAGASCGAIHPLQTFASPTSGFAALPGSSFAVDGDPEALAWACQIADSLHGAVLRIRSDARALYHAAAVLASNDIVATLDAAIQILCGIGIPEAEARRAVGPIARAALENTLEKGAEAALTGPVERKDFETVSRHLQALNDVPASIHDLYRAAAMQALEITLRRDLKAHA